MFDELLDQTTKQALSVLLQRMAESNEYLWLYILSSMSGTLYAGITNGLRKRSVQHKLGINNGFTKKYGCKKLMYFEMLDSPDEAIDREKQVKRWRREKKERLIRMLNPKWVDLAGLLPVCDE